MSPGWLVVGRPFGANDARVEAAVRLLRLAVPTHMSANVHGAHWLKLIVNLNNALPALTDCTVHQVFADDYLRRLGVQLMREGLRVAARAGVRLESLPDVSVWLARLLGWLPLGLAAGLAAAKASRMQTAWPLLGSTLQSLRRRRPTEIDYLNGEVVRLGRQVGEPTPLNAAVVRLVHQVEQTGTFLTAEEIRRAVGTA
jgi:2-dehydropantoate 2-reductase